MKRTELKRKSPLHPGTKLQLKRAPMKRSRKPTKAAAEKRHLERVANLQCIIPGCHKPPPSTVHHVRHKVTRSGTFARVDRRVVPLCPAHHLHDHGPDSVERIHEAGIFEKFGVDLWAEAERLWDESNG